MGQRPQKVFALTCLAGLLAGNLWASSNAFSAETSSSTTTSSEVGTPAAAPSPLSVLTVLGFDTNRAPLGDVDHSMSMAFELWLKYKFSETSNLLGYFALSQELTGERTLLTSDSTLSWQIDSKPLMPGLTFRPYLRAVLPTSHASLYDVGLITGLRAAAQLGYQVGSVGGFLELSAGRNFHVDSVSVSGRSNNAYAAGGRVYVGWSLTEALSVSGDFRLNSGWTYQNGIPRTTFLFAQEVAYQISDVFGVSLAHSNEGDLLKPNGLDTNVAIISDQGSKFSFSASYQL